MTIYGIKNCSTVAKARRFMRENGIEFDFVDYKVESVGKEQVRRWAEQIDIDKLFNNRGKKYRDLGLKKLELDRDGKIEWMARENYLLKRPVIEYGNDEALVSYDEDLYREIFLEMETSVPNNESEAS